jgi:DNA-binding MarR family transcriptional regulator
MDGLINRGLVERHPDPDDGRRVTHHLTAEGRSALECADRAVGDRLVLIGAHVHAGDSNRLIASLARFGEAIRAARAAGAA